MIPRTVESLVHSLLQGFPIVTMTGPRQSGKTTLARYPDGAVHPLRGQIFETFIVSELRKGYLNRGEPPLFYFWRDSNGNEIDLLIESGGRLMPVEIKSGQTLNRDFFTGLERWTAVAGDQARDPTLIYGDRDEQDYKGIRLVGWDRLGNLF